MIRFFPNTAGLEIFSLSIFNTELVTPEETSTTNNLPFDVDK